MDISKCIYSWLTTSRCQVPFLFQHIDMVDATVHVQFCHIIRNIGNSQLNVMAKDESEWVKVCRLTFYIEYWTVLSISFFTFYTSFKQLETEGKICKWEKLRKVGHGDWRDWAVYLTGLECYCSATGFTQSSTSLALLPVLGVCLVRPRRKCVERRVACESGSDSGSSSGSVRASRGSWGSWSSASSVEGDKDPDAPHHRTHHCTTSARKSMNALLQYAHSHHIHTLHYIQHTHTQAHFYLYTEYTKHDALSIT